MDPMHLHLWHQMTMTQSDRARAAHQRYLRAEQIRQAQANRPTLKSVLARAWKGLAGKPREAVEPGELRTGPASHQGRTGGCGGC